MFEIGLHSHYFAQSVRFKIMALAFPRFAIAPYSSLVECGGGNAIAPSSKCLNDVEGMWC